MLVFDTNVLIDAANPYSEFHQPCRRVLEEAQIEPSPSFLTCSICYEFLRVTTHGSAVPSPRSPGESWAFIQRLLESPSSSILLPTDRHAATLTQTISEMPDIRGNTVHDLHIATLMREHGVSRICTRDADFYWFPFLEVINPLRQPA